MKFGTIVVGLLFVLPGVASTTSYNMTQNASFSDACLLYYEPHGCHILLDQRGVPLGLCDVINAGDELFFGCIHSDTSFWTSTSFPPDSGGWSAEVRELLNTYRVHIDSVIRGGLIAGSYLDLNFRTQRSTTRSKFLSFNAQGRTLFQGQLTPEVGVDPVVPKMLPSSKAIFLLRKDDNVFTPVVIAKQEPECVEVLVKCSELQDR